MKVKPIGELLMRERKRRGLTRATLARQLGKSPQLIALWEFGFAEPRPANRAIVVDWLRKNGGAR